MLRGVSRPPLEMLRNLNGKGSSHRTSNDKLKRIGGENRKGTLAGSVADAGVQRTGPIRTGRGGGKKGRKKLTLWKRKRLVHSE